MIRNVASQKIQVFAYNYSTGAPATGDAANLTAYLKKDSGANTALGDTSATEVSSTNSPGWYEFDVTQGETDAVDLLFTGKSSTANVVVVGCRITTVPANFALASIDSNGRLDVIKVAGTTQTARDLGANLDAAVSSRLAAASYTAPDNATIGTTGARVLLALPAAAPAAQGGLWVLGANVADGVSLTAANGTALTITAGAGVAAHAVNLSTTSSGGSALRLGASGASGIAFWANATGTTSFGLRATGTSADVHLTNSTAPTLKAAILTAGAIDATVAPNLDAAVSSRLAAASYVTPDNADIVLIKAKTDLIPAAPAAVGDVPTASQTAAAVWASVVSGSMTALQFVRLIGSALFGKRSNAGTATEQYDDPASPGTARIVGNLDASGNGTPTLTP